MEVRRAKALEIEAEIVSHDAVPRISNRSSKITKKTANFSPKKEKTNLKNVEIDEEFAEMRESDNESDNDEDFVHNDAIAFHDRFFEASKRSKTSNNTLKIDKNEVQKRMEIIGENAKPIYCEDFKKQFRTWDRYLAHDYSLLLYGLGSKLPVMKSYYEHLRAQDFDCLFFNAWKDDASDKVLFDTILTDALDEKPSSSVENAVERLVEHYSSDEAFQLVIFLNNIESNCIARSLDLLVELVNCKRISLVATIDKIYGAFAFDQCQRSQLNFISIETATFMPYVQETKSGHSIWAKSAGKIGVASLQHVYDSLTANGQGVLKIIIKDQIVKIKEKKDGPSFKELYKLCRKSFLVNSEAALKAQLVELKDHMLIGEGTQEIRIQLQTSQLEEFLRTNNK